MTQIQALKNLSQTDLVKLIQTERQQHADDMDMLSKELASRKRVAPEGQAVVGALNDLLGAAHPAYIQDEYLRNKLIKARDKAFKALEKNRLDQKEKGGSIAIPTAEKSSVVAAQCTCPSGNGSLRWPCPAHPPESVNLTKSSNQQIANKPPETPQQIVASLRDLSERMKTVGASMSYFGGFNGAMAHHGREMVGAGAIAGEWADGIEQDISVGTASPTTDTD